MTDVQRSGARSVGQLDDYFVDLLDGRRASLLAAEERLHLLCYGVTSFTEPDGQGIMTLA